MSTSNSIIKLFGKALIGKELNFQNLTISSMQVGYLIHPDCATLEVMEFLKDQKVNYNSTFYKTWSDVTSKNRLELFIDQVLHYMSTYGTDFQGTPYIPNENPHNIPWTEFKVILPITTEEVIERCEKMLSSGIALKGETIELIFNALQQVGHNVDLEIVKNKEAKMYLHVKTGTTPKYPVEIVRFIVYLATGKSLLIKDKSTIEAVKASSVDINKFDLEKLAQVFFRFKPIFLALKQNKSRNKFVINKIRRLAKTEHKPLKKGLLESVLGDANYYSDFIKQIDKISNFKKVQLMQTILVRKKELSTQVYPIRNGKIWIKEGKLKREYSNAQYLDLLYSILRNFLIHSLSEKKGEFYIPSGMNITCPTSEKNFIGAYPIGTSFDLTNSDAIVGIHWRGIEGANDLDLKLIDIEGNQYGWNAAYYNNNQSLVFSGDMTSANPEATELFYASKGFSPAIVKVNLYSGNPNSKFRFFIAKEKINNIQRGYMVNPNNIIFQVESEMDSQEKSLGVITGDKFILSQFRTGRGRVAGDSVTNKYTEYALNTLDCFVDLKSILLEAGFTIKEQKMEFVKDDLIRLFS